jgi:nucleoside-diphosphate-sugar epimerase
VLVTGATGQCGRFFIERLVARGVPVVALARRAESLQHLGQDLLAKVEPVVCDLADGCGALPIDLAAVVHMAAQSVPGGAPTWQTVRDNVVATARLRDFVLDTKVSRFILFSTMSVYGRISVPVVDETVPSIAPDSYGMTKLLAEGLLADTADRLPALALRLPGVLGPDARSPWVARVLAALCRGEPVTVFNALSPFNNAVHVDDLADFVATLLLQPLTGFDVVNLAAAGTVPIAQVPRIMAASIGVTAQVHAVGENGSAFRIDCGRACQRYGFSPPQIEDLLARFAREAARGLGRTVS